MATITGVLEGLIPKPVTSRKTGKTYTAYDIKVNGTIYSIGFDPIKIAAGETVQFSATQNEKGYWNVDDPKAIRTVAANVAAQMVTAQASGATPDARQSSIERQTCLKAAAEVVAAQITAGVLNGQPNAAVSALVSDFMRILHPAPKAQPPKRVEPEDVNQDIPFDDDLPY